jgi:hypothetical protein
MRFGLVRSSPPLAEIAKEISYALVLMIMMIMTITMIMNDYINFRGRGFSPSPLFMPGQAPTPGCNKVKVGGKIKNGG